MEENLNSAVKDTTETDSIFKKLVDLNNSVVCLFWITVCYIIYMKHHLCHLYQLDLQTLTLTLGFTVLIWFDLRRIEFEKDMEQISKKWIKNKDFEVK